MARAALAAAIIAALLPAALANKRYPSVGILKLDNWTVDKVLDASPGHNFLLKFDSTVPYGDKENAWKVFCRQCDQVPKFFCGEIPVQEYFDETNVRLRKSFGVGKHDKPAFILYNETNKKDMGLRYTDEEVTVDKLAAWLSENSAFEWKAKSVREFDDLLRKFLAEGMPDEQLEAAKKLAEGVYAPIRKAQEYPAIMQRVKEMGAGWLQSEAERLRKLLAGDEAVLAAEQKEKWQVKLDILEGFEGAFGDAGKGKVEL